MTDINLTREAVEVLATVVASPVVNVTREAVEVLSNIVTTPDVRVTRQAVEVLTSHEDLVFIVPSGIASSEAFGLPTLLPFIFPIGIPSNEAFGLASTAPIISPTGIPSAEAFGTQVVTVLPKRARSFRIVTTLFGVLAILPFEAIVPCNETLQWLTDVQISHNGTEHRERVRAEPRTSFRFMYSEGINRLAEATLNQYAAMNLDWIVPLWTECQFIGAIASASGVITIDTTDLDYRDNSLALIYESPLLWEVVEISTVAAGSLTLLAVTENDYVNAKVLPARLGLIAGAINKVGTGYSAITTINYDVTDNLALTPADTPEQFLGSDIYFDEPLKGANDTYKKTITTDLNRIDFELGLFDKLTPWLYNRVDIVTSHILQDKQEIRAFKRLLERRAGRQTSFWEPTFEADLVVTSVGTIVSNMNVDIIGQTDWPMIRTHIAILDKDGTWYPRTILSFIQITTVTFELVLDVPLNIDAATIECVSYLGLKRFNTDRVELKWIGNNTIQAAINTIEITP